jgi:hypothetical protein
VAQGTQQQGRGDPIRIGFAAIGAVVVLVLAMVVFGKDASSDGLSDGFSDVFSDGPVLAQDCDRDLATVKTGIAAWNTQWASGDENDIFDTEYPTSMDDLADLDGGPLVRASTLYDVSGDGSTYPTITSLGDCPDPD